MITYTEYLQSIYDDQLAYAKDEGRAEGRNEIKTKTARAMLKKGISIDDIIEITELTREQIESLVH